MNIDLNEYRNLIMDYHELIDVVIKLQIRLVSSSVTGFIKQVNICNDFSVSGFKSWSSICILLSNMCLAVDYFAQ